MNNKMKKIFYRINDIPIRQKFIWIYIVLFLIPMLVIILGITIQLRREIAAQESSIQMQTIDKVMSDMGYMMNSCFSIAIDISVDQALNEALSKEYANPSEYFKTYTDDLKDKTFMYATGYNNVIRVSMYADNNNLLYGGNIYGLNEKIKESAWMKEYLDSSKKTAVLTWLEKHPHMIDTYYNRISIVRKMDEFSQLDTEMYTRIDIEVDKLSQLLKPAYGIHFVVTDESGKILFDESPNQLLTGQGRPIFHSQDYTLDNKIFTYDYLLQDGTVWYLNAIVPKAGLNDVMNRYSGLFFLSIGGGLLISVVVISVFSRSYNQRIQVLSHHMKKVEKGNFRLIEGDYGKDEIGSLIEVFNRMTDRINDLVNQVLKFKIKEKDLQLQSVKAELQFLHSQMDPHFLFNTLNAILVVSNRKGYEEITDIIRSLSRTLRYLIEWDDSMVPLEKEMTFIRMYLEIEKFRFRDKFNYEIDVDEELLQKPVMKLSIQPFVENACKHGIQASRNNGLLRIYVYQEKGEMIISVKDNGIGISKQSLNEILNSDSDSHIGVTNVRRRLALNYENYQFNIISSEGLGTEVIMRIPI
jgi:two-component system sensor histidine kinase YesM